MDAWKRRLKRGKRWMLRDRRRAWALAGVLAVGGLGLVVAGPWAVSQAKRASAASQLDYHAERIERAAAAAGLPAELVRTIVIAESSGRAGAVSNRGARGLMQITPITEKDVLQRNAGWERGDLFDPDYNLKIGTTYLAYLLKRFEGDLTLAVAAYHMGPTAVRRMQRAQPGLSSQALVQQHAGPQTRAYVDKVLKAYGG
jgi:soluble lytic murein transglycosylase-like protein